jgi:hypothetical protein
LSGSGRQWLPSVRESVTLLRKFVEQNLVASSEAGEPVFVLVTFRRVAQGHDRNTPAYDDHDRGDDEKIHKCGVHGVQNAVAFYIGTFDRIPK